MRKRLFWLVLLIILVAASAGLGQSLGRIQPAYPGLPPDVPLAADKSYGVNADLTAYPGLSARTGYQPEALDRTLTQMNRLGLHWIRQPFPWARIEPVRGQFDWERWDRVVEAASQHDLHLIAVLDTAPAWARPPHTGHFTPPTELADFGAFARALAGRYGARLDYYQIWDEPNLSAHWGDRFVDPAAYAHLLREGAVNIRAADAKAVILTAALAPTVESGPLNLNEPDFLARLYAAHAAPWFDIVAAQPYGFLAEPGAPADRGKLNFARAELLRQTMAAHGDGGKAVWITAFGWSALPPRWKGQPPPWPSHLPERQVAYTTQAIRRARANWPWLGPMLFAAWDTDSLSAADPRRGLALVAGETPLPQAGTFRSEEVASLGTYPADHPSGHYDGAWRFSPAGADVPRHPPARLTIRFEGTRLDLTLRRGDFRGFLYVTVDGQPVNRLPQSAGRTYVVLYDPLGKMATITLARYLPDGSHTAVIEAEGGWYQWPVVSWRVSREGDTRSIGLSLALVGVLAVAAAVGLVRSLPRWPLRRWLRSGWEWFIARLAVRYLALSTPIHLLVLAGTALAFYAAPGTFPSLALLIPFFLAVLARPDLGLALVAFSLPFFLLTKSLGGQALSMTEISLALVGLACVVRRTITFPARRLDWAAWSLTGIAAVGPLVSADWPALTLMLLPLAGVLALIAGNQQIGKHLHCAQVQVSANRQIGKHLHCAQVQVSTSWPSGEGGIRRLADRLTRNLDLAVMALVGLAFAATLAAQNFGVSNYEFRVVIWDAAAFYALIRLLPDLPQERNPFSQSLSWRSGQGKRVSEPVFDISQQVGDSGGGVPNLLGAFAKDKASKTFKCRKQAEVVWPVVDGWLLGSTLMAGYAIYQFFFTNQAITAEGVHRALGIYGSPNNLALLLDRSAPVLIALAAFGQARRKQILYGLALFTTLAALILTFSRGALLLGLPAAVLFIGLMRGGRALWAALGILFASGAGMIPLFGTDRFRSVLDTSAGTGFFRLRLWQSAWTMLRDHPWLGVGLDNFLYQYRTRYILPDAWQEPNLSHPHNILLDFATRLGVGGVIILLWLQFAFWRAALSLYRRLPEGAEKALTLGLMSSMVAILAHGVVDHGFFLVDLAFIFALTLGMVGRMTVVLHTTHVNTER